MGHNGKLGQKYSKTAVGVAVAGGLVGVSALTAVTVATGAAEALIALPVFVTPGSMLAGHRFFNTPSTSPPPCGPVRINDMRWSCCKGPEIGGEGCTPLCDLCDSEWGSGAPCVLIRNPDRGLQGQMENYEVFIKNHDLVENTPLANST
ncbi:uncharacterized protein LOC111714292 [Eurytemora carolleeae]|uniref:uncharacterized protein LOC111714292 n=1 Tax=Eurytemora carolleeae TaxID=1294199 RepID=UPI000C762D31|nr:uncharacterized protein LOC111714292 [Eurytemora carolleeae]|eukprot:XP_023345132.1 uncharacterized protein LOC111714292 [Eurytemora affinis]